MGWDITKMIVLAVLFAKSKQTEEGGGGAGAKGSEMSPYVSTHTAHRVCESKNRSRSGRCKADGAEQRRGKERG